MAICSVKRALGSVHRWHLGARGFALLLCLIAGLAQLQGAHAAGPAEANRSSTLGRMPFPERVELDGRTLVLNGSGTRTYGWVGLEIYTAALYLPERQASALKILNSEEPKIVMMRMLRGARPEHTRRAWTEYIEANCRKPCQIAPASLQTFLDLLPPTVAGEGQTLIFRAGGELEYFQQDRLVGRLRDPLLARVILATWIGDAPTTPELKKALLEGGR